MSAKKTETGFWDTSAVVPLCCSQPIFTVRSRQFAKRFPRKIVWWGISVEAFSALNRLWQNDILDDKQLKNSFRNWENIRRSLYFIEPDNKVIKIAETLPKTYGLRALDSFQLAAALIWCKEKPRNRIFVCYDIKLTEAAEKAGFTVLGV